MRELKFRVFEPVNGGMHYVDLAFMTKDGNFILPTGSQDLMGRYTRMNLDAVRIMQYTGLKDKNGKEIYEGDIVDLGQTVNGCNIFIVIWDEEKIGWNVRYGIKMNCPRNYEYSVSEFFKIDKLTGDGVNVIGDIYNNPELLK